MNDHASKTRVRFIVMVALAAAALTLAGCSQDKSEDRGESEGADKAQAPPIRVHPANSDLAFRFFDKSTGEFKTVSTVDDVPEEVRKAVITFDAGAPPAPANLLYIADLTQTGDDGSFSYRVADRYKFENGIVVVPDGASKSAKPRVTMYSTEWCGVCKKAKKWFASRGVAYVERDMEKDPQARRSLEADAKRAGVSMQSIGGGVPIIVVGDKILSGFSPQAIEQALSI